MPRVLLVDDEPSVVDVLSLAFEEAGYEVVTARDGRAGLEALDSQKISAVVSDVNMPRLDGFQLCRTLRTRRLRGDRSPA